LIINPKGLVILQKSSIYFKNFIIDQNCLKQKQQRQQIYSKNCGTTKIKAPNIPKSKPATSPRPGGFLCFKASINTKRKLLIAAKA
jgi:hypothetical protein